MTSCHRVASEPQRDTARQGHTTRMTRATQAEHRRSGPPALPETDPSELRVRTQTDRPAEYDHRKKEPHSSRVLRSPQTPPDAHEGIAIVF